MNLIHYSTLFTARAFLFCSHKQTLQITEKKKRILPNTKSKSVKSQERTQMQNLRRKRKNSPKSNTQPPNSLRLDTNRFGSPNPRNIINPPTDAGNITRKSRRKRIRRRVLISQIGQRRALQVRERLADDDGDDNQGDQKQCVENCAGEEWEDVVYVEDCGDYAVDCCDAGLWDC